MASLMLSMLTAVKGVAKLRHGVVHTFWQATGISGRYSSSKRLIIYQFTTGFPVFAGFRGWVFCAKFWVCLPGLHGSLFLQVKDLTCVFVIS